MIQTIKPVFFIVGIVIFLCGVKTSWAEEPKMEKSEKTTVIKVKEGLRDPVPLAMEISDIKGDPNITWGVHKSGMRYAILPNVEPPGRVSLRLHVDAGSLMEKDNQQGLAHFLEHMAFNGTTNFPEGTMVKYFQRLGMGFGNHTNAHTSFNETVYKLELPNTETETLNDSFKLLRDYADGMKLPMAEIDRERGIIMSEKRDRDSVEWRTFVEQMKFYLPESIVGRRMPIGTEEVIQGAPRERFVEFYNDWYTPNRMVLIAVGDIDVQTVEAQIDDHFDTLEARDKTPSPDLGNITNRGLATHSHYEEESGKTSVSIEVIGPPSSDPHNLKRRGHDLRLKLASQMMNRRLERIAKDETSPLKSGSVYAADLFGLQMASVASISADCSPEEWKASLKVIEQELRRVLEHGFTEAELKEARANQFKNFKLAADRAATRLSRTVADSLSSSIGNRRVFSHPADSLAWAEKALPAVTAAECQAVLKEAFSEKHERLLMISGNADIDDPSTELTNVYKASQSIAVAAPKQEEAAVFAYAKMPTSGKIAKREEVEDLEITQLHFENNVRVNLKNTDFEKETIYVRARIGSGKITAPKDQPGLSTFASSAFNGGGLEAHSADDLKRIFAGKSVSSSMQIADDAFVFNGRTNSGDLLDQLLMMRAYVTNPGFRKEAVTTFGRQLDGLYKYINREADGVSQAKAAVYLRGGDTRFGFPEREEMEKRSIDEAKAWIVPALKSGYLELSIVGDFDKEKAIEAISQTFGSLPKRAAEKEKHSSLREVKFPSGGKKNFSFESEIPKASTNVYWPTADMYDIKKTRRLGMVGAVLDDRLREKVREELGDAYSPFAHNFPSDTWKDFGYLQAAVTIDPSRSDSVAKVVGEIAEELATGESITQDEIERSLKPRVVSIEEMRRTNRYWLGSVLESCQENPDRLEWSRHFVKDYKSITLDEVNALAKEYLKPENMVVITIAPE